MMNGQEIERFICTNMPCWWGEFNYNENVYFCLLFLARSKSLESAKGLELFRRDYVNKNNSAVITFDWDNESAESINIRAQKVSI